VAVPVVWDLPPFPEACHVGGGGGDPPQLDAVVVVSSTSCTPTACQKDPAWTSVVNPLSFALLPFLRDHLKRGNDRPVVVPVPVSDVVPETVALRMSEGTFAWTSF
jgi:hypothetical protein